METNSLSFRYFLFKESDYSIMTKETYTDRLGLLASETVSFILCMLGNFAYFLLSADFFQN